MHSQNPSNPMVMNGYYKNYLQMVTSSWYHRQKSSSAIALLWRIVAFSCTCQPKVKAMAEPSAT